MGMERTPYPPDALIHTLDGLRNPLQLLPACVSQKLGLLQDLLLLQLPHAYGLFPTIDIVPPNDRMFAGSGRDVDLDLRVRSGEVGESALEEGLHAGG